MPQRSWHAVILAAGRGPNDPMAKAFGIAHKCLLPVAGKPMLLRVIEALCQTAIERPYLLSIELGAPFAEALGTHANDVKTVTPSDSAPASVLSAAGTSRSFPLLITTGDHPLLTPSMLEHVMREAETSGADVLAALATGEVIRAAHPDTNRTYFKLGGTEVSGCNIFAIMTPAGLKLVEAWRDVEKNRKKPLKLVAAFGLRPLFEFLLGRLTPQRAFALLSERLGIKAAPIFMPQAEAAIDVDKPSDLAIAEMILAKRG